MKKRHQVKIGFILFTIPVLLWTQPVYVPLEHWAYEFLERMQTKGRLSVMYGAFPYTRSEIADALLEIEKQKSPTLTSAETGRLNQLKEEFADELGYKTALPRTSGERHFMTWKENLYKAFVDLEMNQKLIHRSDDLPLLSHTTLGGFLRGQLSERFGFSLYARNTLRKGENLHKEQFDPSLGAPVVISGKNAYSDDASAYFTYQLPHILIEFGRDEAEWGPGRTGHLILSRHGAYFDMLRLRLQFRRFQWTSIHGKLNHSPQPKFLAAHRLEWRIKSWLKIAGSELVIYGNRDIEPMYLNPLMPYHVAEHHLGDRDNNTMAFDITLFPSRGHRAVMEFFLDDYTSSENPFTYYGNKWAFLAGWHWVDPLGLAGCDISTEYTRIEPYVYTHTDTINVYQEYGRSIGYFLGPNSENLNLEISCLLNRDIDATLLLAQSRKGDGDLFTPANADISTKKKFLSGIVETRRQAGVEVTAQIFRDCFIQTRYSFQRIINREHQRGQHDNVHQIYFDFKVNY
jgi:hypothetical protein